MMKAGRFHRSLLILLAWLVAGVLFFPVFWMAITAFKTHRCPVSEFDGRMV